MPHYYVKIAQLKKKGGISNRQIAETLGISRNTVNAAVKQIQASGFTFDEIAGMSEGEIDENFRRRKEPVKQNYDYVMPDFKALAKELVKSGVTKQLLWEEYNDEFNTIHLQFRQI